MSTAFGDGLSSVELQREGQILLRGLRCWIMGAGMRGHMLLVI